MPSLHLVSREGGVEVGQEKSHDFKTKGLGLRRIAVGRRNSPSQDAGSIALPALSLAQPERMTCAGSRTGQSDANRGGSRHSPRFDYFPHSVVGYCFASLFSLLSESFLVTRKFHTTSFALRSRLVFPTAFSGSYCSPPGQVFPAPFTLYKVTWAFS